MSKYILLMLLMSWVLAACGGAGDDTATIVDERQCIIFVDADLDEIIDSIDDEPALGGVQFEAVGGDIQTCNTDVTTELIVDTIDEVNPGLLRNVRIRGR